MKKITRIIAVFLLLIGSSTIAAAQCSKNCKNCKKTKALNMKEEKALACKLTSPELRKRKEEVIAVLKGKVVEKKELKNGYKYRFEGTDEMLDNLTAFIKSERQCCNFFNFKLSVMNDTSIWLEISGDDGVKEFIEAELEM